MDGEQVDVRRKVLDAKDLPSRKVHVPQWGVDMWVRSLRGWDREAMEASWIKRRQLGGDDANEYRAFVVCWCATDENGKLIFDQHSDVAALTKKSSAALRIVFDAADELNALTGEAVKELEGN